MVLVDRVNRRATHSAALHHTETDEGGQRLLNRPQAVLVADQAVNLPPGQRSTRTQQHGQRCPARTRDQAPDLGVRTAGQSQQVRHH